MQPIFHEMEKKYGFRLLREPERLSGGFMHKMYALHTTKGSYAVKLLNPFVMKRENVMENYESAERLERLLEKRNIPILPSLSFEGKKMQQIDGQFFYVFDFYDGRAVSGKEITAYHCREMGAVLAAIHQIDQKEEGAPAETMRIDWDFYIAEMEKENRELYEMLCENRVLIADSQERGNFARKKLPEISAICHNDMDCKNVLWKGKEFRIIDLECLSYNHPMMELFELALCWSGYEECEINFSLFREFLAGYAAAGGTLPDDWETLYDCNNGRLEWLEYNIKRVLGIGCGEDEKELGKGQVIETIRHVIYYHSVKEQILSNCFLM